MSDDGPCNCQQAQDYERVLREVLDSYSECEYCCCEPAVVRARVVLRSWEPVQRHRFTVVLEAEGTSRSAAWDAAIAGLMQNPGSAPPEE